MRLKTRTEGYETHADLAIKRVINVGRDEYLDYMTFCANRRPLFTELFGPIIGLKKEWAEQGATPEELDMSAFPFRQAGSGSVPVSTGWMGGEPERVLEETGGYIISRDRMGRTMKLCKGKATIPLPLDFPVKTMDDWQRVKHHFEFSEERFGKDWQQKARAIRESDRVVCVGIPGGFDLPRELMGEEVACLAYFEQPELMRDILDTVGKTAYRVLDRVSAAAQIDKLTVHEDMAGRTGPLAGPAQFEEFIIPYYRRIWDLLQSRGARVFDVDSDGDINAIIPSFLKAGVNLLHPMEPAANMDIVKTRERHKTRLAFAGGIDKHVLRKSRKEIVAELEYKIPPMVKTGGCVLGLDHRIPNGTPLENYRFYNEKAWEIMDREAAQP